MGIFFSQGRTQSALVPFRAKVLDAEILTYDLYACAAGCWFLLVTGMHRPCHARQVHRDGRHLCVIKANGVNHYTEKERSVLLHFCAPWTCSGLLNQLQKVVMVTWGVIIHIIYIQTMCCHLKIKKLKLLNCFWGGACFRNQRIKIMKPPRCITRQEKGKTIKNIWRVILLPTCVSICT